MSDDSKCEDGITDRRAGVTITRSQVTRSTQGVDFSPLAWTSVQQLEPLTEKPLASTSDSDWEEITFMDDQKASPSDDAWDDMSSESSNESLGEIQGVNLGDEVGTDVGGSEDH